MTLRWKTYLLMGATLLVAMLVVYAVSQTVFMRGFANVEARQMQDQVKRAQAAIAQNLAELDADVFSYSSWDDTVAFLETRSTPGSRRTWPFSSRPTGPSSTARATTYRRGNRLPCLLGSVST